MLRHLTATACPVCGEAEIVNEKIKTNNKKAMVHTNGKRWEEREFACGKRLEYSPNYSKTLEMQGYPCGNDSKQAKSLKEQIQFLNDSLIAVEGVGTNQVDLKNEILHTIVKKTEQLQYNLERIER